MIHAATAPHRVALRGSWGLYNGNEAFPFRFFLLFFRVEQLYNNGVAAAWRKNRRVSRGGLKTFLWKGGSA